MLHPENDGVGRPDSSTSAGLSFDIGTAASSRILMAIGGASIARFE
jgi:hypothetical protein